MPVLAPRWTNRSPMTKEALVPGYVFWNRLADVIAAPGRGVGSRRQGDREARRQEDEDKGRQGQEHYHPNAACVATHLLVSLSPCLLSFLFFRPDPAVRRILRSAAAIEIRLFQLAQGVCRERVAFGVRVDAVE